MSRNQIISLIIFFLLFIVGLSTLYVVREGQNGVLLRLGKMVKDPSTGEYLVTNPGLNVKWPILNQARIFDTRLQTLNIEASRIVTSEKKDVLVDYYVKWRIENLPLYYTRTGGNKIRAQVLLQQKLNDGLRAQFGRRDIREVVSSERTGIMQALQNQANESAKILGVNVVDVRIKSIDLPPELSNAVFDRMRAERERIATQHRADGKASAEALRAKADAYVTVTLAKANSQAQQIRGQGDAVATKTYADAYVRDASFFSFYRSLLAYSASFNKPSDILVLQPDGDFFKYFNHAKQKNNKS